MEFVTGWTNRVDKTGWIVTVSYLGLFWSLYDQKSANMGPTLAHVGGANTSDKIRPL